MSIILSFPSNWPTDMQGVAGDEAKVQHLTPLFKLILSISLSYPLLSWSISIIPVVLGYSPPTTARAV